MSLLSPLGMFKPYLVGGLAVALLGASLWLWFGGERKGIAKCEAKDTAAVVQHEIHETKVDTDALTQLRDDNDRLRGLLAQPIHSVRHAPACPARPSVATGNSLPATPAGDGAGVRTGGGSSPDDSDFDDGPGLQLLAEVAEGTSDALRACQTRSNSLSH